MIELNIIDKVHASLKKAADDATADIISNLYPDVSKYHYKIGVIHGLTIAHQETTKIRKFILGGGEGAKLHPEEDRPFKPNIDLHKTTKNTKESS